MKFSIRYKFAIGFLLIFCVSFNFITIFINKIVIKNNKQIISDEFLVSQRDIDFYLKQYLIINNINYEHIDLEDVGVSLSSKVNSRIIIYSKDGKSIFDSDYNNGILYLNDGTEIEDDRSDLNLSFNGQAAYKIMNIGEKYEVIFSKPIYINDNLIGALRYIRDYSELFENGRDMVLKIKIFILIIFIVLFIFSFILSTKIIIPLIELNKVTKEISKGNFDFNISVKSNDEIGELAENFSMMKEKIKNQIETIKKDRDDLIKSESHRKTFYDNVTHEIKTPLTIIDGYAQMILDEDDIENMIVIKAASKIKKESKRLINMIVNILNISKLESQSSNGLEEKIDMKKCIEDICSEISIKANKYEIVINTNLEEDIYVYANQNDINSMIVNIIDNSIKYSDVKSQINIKLFKDMGNCMMILEDQGKGMDDESVKKVFEPFYRGKNTLGDRKNGNGLGLSIVKSIVDKYDGEINLESKLDVGTRVYIKLPLFTNWQQLD